MLRCWWRADNSRRGVALNVQDQKGKEISSMKSSRTAKAWPPKKGHADAKQGMAHHQRLHQNQLQCMGVQNSHERGTAAANGSTLEVNSLQ